MTTETVQISIDSIRTDGDTQPRVVFNHEVIADYAQKMADGAVFPPVVVFHDEKYYWLGDGFHRVHAKKRAGETVIDAEVRPGTLRDARLYSVGANVTHGLHRTNDDKRRAVKMLLEDEEWSKWSDREIARRCGVSHPFVIKLREEQSGNGYQTANISVARFAERNDTIFTINSSNIGHRLVDTYFPKVDPLLVPLEDNREEEDQEEDNRIESAEDYREYIRQITTEQEKVAITELPLTSHFPPPSTRVEVVDNTPPPVRVQPGQLWSLGRHKLYCGDSSDKNKRFVTLAQQAEASFAFADPPYNAGVDVWDKNFIWDHEYLANIAPIVAVTPGISSIKSFMSLTKMPYKWSMSYWINNGMTRGALGFGNWIYVALFTESSLHRNGQDLKHTDTDLVDLDDEWDKEPISITGNDRDPLKHKGRKPYRMMRHIVEFFAQHRQTVIDPFLGTGTTLIACELTGRTCVGAEINPEYCKSIIRRWEEKTKQTAKLIEEV